MFSQIKIWAIAAGIAIIGILKIMLGMEKSKRKSAELMARIEESNRKNLEASAAVNESIEKERRTWDKSQNERHKRNLKEIEKLDDESLSDADFINQSAKLLKRSNNPKRAH